MDPHEKISISFGRKKPPPHRPRQQLAVFTNAMNESEEVGDDLGVFSGGSTHKAGSTAEAKALDAIRLKREGSELAEACKCYEQ